MPATATATATILCPVCGRPETRVDAGRVENHRHGRRRCELSGRAVTIARM